MKTPQETCANCGRMIGELETPCLFNGKIVCAACNAILRPLPMPPSVKIEIPKRLLIVLLIVGIVVAAYFYERNSISSEEARDVLAKLAKVYEADDKRNPDSDVDRDVMVIPGEVDIQKSNSIDYPRVAVVTMTESLDLNYKNTNASRSELWHITATLGKKDGQWQCIKAEKRLEHFLAIPESAYSKSVGTVNDDTARISNCLREIPP